MSAISSHLGRSVVLPFLIWAAVLLPTLHLHPQHAHEHGDDFHQHLIVHADFWSGATDDHNHSTQHDGNAAFADGAVSFARYSLAALQVRNGGAALPKLERSPQFFLLAPAPEAAQRLSAIAIIKREHPPPGAELRFSPTAPRSPPNIA